MRVPLGYPDASGLDIIIWHWLVELKPAKNLLETICARMKLLVGAVAPIGGLPSRAVAVVRRAFPRPFQLDRLQKSQSRGLICRLA